MPTSHLPHTRARRRARTALGVLALLAAATAGAALATPDDQAPEPSATAHRPTTTDRPTSGLPRQGAATTTGAGRGTVVADRAPHRPPGSAAGAEDDGAVHGGVPVFDAHDAALVNLDPALLGALREAATQARHDGVEVQVNSGWRSAAYQAQLLREAVARYGSAAEAARWVATPQTSAHVSGDAVDIGPTAAASWMSRHGAAFGLCRVYRNEPWHFELRTGAQDHGCPALYADPTQDPRMHQ
ncbi:M15 family metallopeptidase [Phycicoccus sp. M110.8]|uniref:M15 family metallopeptidase n=1 Tax=Phycicoccus sp. M110.8 TaxID=3075433 RepID=UPI0028FD85F4|nr:M15 family metallopeptidase [Phycicoccus sp. M110.8]MDU0312291.1 M15 family metallopeptidase [Phycicoccus sp. M110.8]